MAQPGTSSRVVLAIIWLLLGGAMIAVPVWLGWTRWQAILNGHPAMMAAATVCGLLGFVAVAWSIGSLTLGGRQDREGDPAHPHRRSESQMRRRAIWRIVLAIPALIVCGLLVGILAWARPIQAEASASAAMRSQNNVIVTDKVGWYEMQPARRDQSGKAIKPTTALVFVPGDRIDPRAYAALLRPLAHSGYLVAVIKSPFGVPLTRPAQAEAVLRVHPEIRYWAAGGHAAGGTAAAAFADAHPQINALILYASYPARKLDRTDLKVLSVSGSADTLVTRGEVDASKADLPPSTSFVIIPGAVHSDFGDYGRQPGEGTPTIDHATCQAHTQQVTLDLLASLTPPASKAKK
jgi:hypothetical protein